ncbi:TPA: hypothetical protein WLQ27_000720 [Neisseria gonorrhoeae]
MDRIKSKAGKKMFEVVYMVLAIAYLLFPVRWFAWMYSFYVLCQMLYHWNMADSWIYIGKFILTFGIVMGWHTFVIAFRNKI